MENPHDNVTITSGVNDNVISYFPRNVQSRIALSVPGRFEKDRVIAPLKQTIYVEQLRFCAKHTLTHNVPTQKKVHINNGLTVIISKN